MKKRFQKVLLGQKGPRKAQAINQLGGIFASGQLTVSVAEARQVARLVDRLVVRVKGKEKVVATRYLYQRTGNLKLSQAILAYVEQQGAKRVSGFTTLAHAGYRKGDHTPVMRISLTGFVKPAPAVKTDKVTKTAATEPAQKPAAKKTIKTKAPKTKEVKKSAK